MRILFSWLLLFIATVGIEAFSIVTPSPAIHEVRSMHSQTITSLIADSPPTSIEPVKTFLVWWRVGKTSGHDWVNLGMRQDEFRSVAAKLLGTAHESITFHKAMNCDGEAGDALQYVRGIPDVRTAADIARRLVCVRSIHDIWAEGKDYHKCAEIANMITVEDARLGGLIREGGEQTWCARVRRLKPENQRYGASLKSPIATEEQRILAMFEPILRRVPGRVKLQEPRHALFVLEGPFTCSTCIDLHEQSTYSINDAQSSVTCLTTQQNSADMHDKCTHNEKSTSDTQELNTYINAEQNSAGGSVMLTRQLSLGLSCNAYSLPERAFLGTTTMDNEISFMMANSGQVVEGSSVLDPFCGSGGCLLSAAALGATCTVGVEVDKRISYEDVNRNFLQKSRLPLTALFTGDSTTYEMQFSAMEANGGSQFDAVVTDPPYGVRENSAGQSLPGSVFSSLLDMCGRQRGVLKFGGRLVFFFPTAGTCTDVKPLLPVHAHMKLISATRQPLSKNLSRWLITYERT